MLGSAGTRKKMLGPCKSSPDLSSVPQEAVRSNLAQSMRNPLSTNSQTVAGVRADLASMALLSARR